MSIIEIIKERLHIEDIISRYVPLTKTGKNLRGLCPFHNEQTPSFFVFPDSQRYKCFGCGASGDLFDFVMRREGWDMDMALRELAAQAGVVLSPQSAEEKRRLLLQREKEAVFAVAAEYFHQALGLARDESSETGSPGLEYARRRSFTDETLRAAGVGFFGKAWRDLREALRTKEYPRLATRAANAEFVGWYDTQYIYLLSKVAFRVVHQFYRDSGVVFPDTEHGVKVKLKEQGLLFPAESGTRKGFYINYR